MMDNSEKVKLESSTLCVPEDVFAVVRHRMKKNSFWRKVGSFFEEFNENLLLMVVTVRI